MLRIPPPKLQRWRALRSELLASYRIFDVCRVDLADAQGKPRGDAFTLRTKDWCNVVAVTPDDRVLLVWQYRFGSDAMSLEIPGGVVDPGESPEQAARRELREETGYEAEALDLLLAVEPNPAIQNNRCFTFVAHGVRQTGATEFDPQEEIETSLLPVADIAALLDGGQVTHSLVFGALEAYCRKRGAGDKMERLVMDIEELQKRKVVDLAQRLRPGVTVEDLRNPHDFPELGDPDWQYEDGMLAGVQSVLAAVRARRRDGTG